MLHEPVGDVVMREGVEFQVNLANNAGLLVLAVVSGLVEIVGGLSDQGQQFACRILFEQVGGLL